MPPERGDKFEDYPLTRAEYIAAMVHLYRGEQHRAQVWRTRLDTTTNWAVLSLGALLSYTFGERGNHIILVLGMYMIFTMLVFEARRFRFYDVWRNRVRRVEENFYVPILRRDLTSAVENWGFYVAEDLLNPSYKITFLMAFKARLVNNYLPLFLVMLASWVIKVNAQVGEEHASFFQAMGGNGVEPELTLAGVGCLYGFLAFVFFFVKRHERPEEIYFGSKTASSIDDVG